MKPLKLNKETIEAILNGATKIVLPIDGMVTRMSKCGNSKIEDFCPIEINQPYYVVEEFSCYQCKHIKHDYNISDSWEDCGNKNSKNYYTAIGNIENCICKDYEMQPHQSRIPRIEFNNREVKQIKKLTATEKFNLMEYDSNYEILVKDNFKKWLKSQNITTENVFIADIKEVKWKQ